MLTFREVETAAYCPRKLYYRRRACEEDLGPPPGVRAIRELAHRYPTLLAGDDEAIRDVPVALSPSRLRSRLRRASARLEAWDALCEPPDRDVHVAGSDCRGVVHKRLPGPSLSLVFAGEPPDQGVWHPQSVRLVAAARALAHECEAPVERVYAEYPAYGVLRAVDLDARRLGAYRAAVRTARSIDGPPSRTNQRSKCEPCDYREECGVPTASLLSRLAP